MPDEATLNQMIVQYPFTPFSEITTRPILDGDTALRQWREILREMMGAGPGVGGDSPPADVGAVSYRGGRGVAPSALTGVVAGIQRPQTIGPGS